MTEHRGAEPRATVKLNVELCIGVGNCELLQPDHFTIDEDTGIAELTGDGVMAVAAAEEVVDRCPSGALSIEP
ncbi:MAG: (4Fe-4S)-binding protein [Acidimicrobiales bacterium]